MKLPVLTRNLCSSAYLCLGVSASACADTLTLHYTCDDGAQLEVSYTRAEDGTSTVAIMEPSGERYHLAQERAASGARYSGDGMVWWSKGRDGFLRQRDRIVHANCVQSDH